MGGSERAVAGVFVVPEPFRDQESGEPQELIYTTRIGKYLSQQMNSTLELCCIPVPPPPLEH